MDYITLLNGQRVRAVFSLGVYSKMFERMSVQKVKDFANGILDVPALMVVFALMIEEGEALDKREWRMQPRELAGYLDFKIAEALVEIIKDSLKVIGRPHESFKKFEKN